ncbi:MAG TPA: acylphosphatase [Jiangellales bacterium]|nr:acylphosphatase [Jiangellales bacterium]
MTGGHQAARTDAARAVAVVHGMVQAVGFRWWTRSRAWDLGLTGSATNLADGSVEVVVEGTRSDCEQMLTQLRSGRTPGRVDRVDVRWEPPAGLAGFDLA